jgi:hypothetical protein
LTCSSMPLLHTSRSTTTSSTTRRARSWACTRCGAENIKRDPSAARYTQTRSHQTSMGSPATCFSMANSSPQYPADALPRRRHHQKLQHHRGLPKPRSHSHSRTVRTDSMRNHSHSRVVLTPRRYGRRSMTAPSSNAPRSSPRSRSSPSPT